jgi:hypothetical protein
MQMPLRRLAVLAALAVLAIAPAVARADGDPASDFLVFSTYYAPYHPAPPKALTDQLGQLLKDAKADGYPIRVAIIGSKDDLGSVPQLFGHPQLYARFLGSELAFAYKGRLLIAMPQGFGVRHIPPKEAKALKGLKVADPSSDGLTLATMNAVRRLASESGHTLPAVSAATTTASGSSSSTAPIVIAVVGGVLVLAALGLVLWRWRRRPEEEPEPVDEDMART